MTQPSVQNQTNADRRAARLEPATGTHSAVGGG